MPQGNGNTQRVSELDYATISSGTQYSRQGTAELTTVLQLFLRSIQRGGLGGGGRGVSAEVYCTIFIIKEQCQNERRDSGTPLIETKALTRLFSLFRIQIRLVTRCRWIRIKQNQNDTPKRKKSLFCDEVDIISEELRNCRV
jgi:hypothetical protein